MSNDSRFDSAIKNRSAINQHVGAQIRLRRNALNMSQQEFAIKLLISELDVQNIEEGLLRPEPALLVHLAQILELPVSNLFNGIRAKVENSSDCDNVLPFKKT